MSQILVPIPWKWPVSLEVRVPEGKKPVPGGHDFRVFQDKPRGRRKKGRGRQGSPEEKHLVILMAFGTCLQSRCKHGL